MNKKQKILLISIIISLIVIITILMLIININKNKNKNLNSTNEYNVSDSQTGVSESENDYIESEKLKYNLKYVENEKEYFTINSITSKYLSLLADKEIDKIEKIISPKVLSEYKINNSNILKIQNMPKVENSSDIYLADNKILTTETNNAHNIYIINTECYCEDTAEKTKVLLMVELDKQSQLYNIYPYQYVIDKGFDKLNYGDKFNDYTGEEITNREENEFVYVNEIDNKSVAKEYFNNYSKILLYNQEEAYNRLDPEYKKIKFKNLETFKVYLNKMVYAIYTMDISKYKVNKTDDYTDYLCTDQYNNYYIFREKDGIMNYTVFLDSYTVDLDVFKENYEKASDEEKVSLNVGKFKQMLNTKDYNTIYDKLNETFRKNNFSTVSKLEEYLKKNTYEINSIKVENKTQQNDYYVCECTLVDQTNTEQTKKMTIMIKLLDNNNFSMSFSIK